jgi:hypothetical protein
LTKLAFRRIFFVIMALQGKTNDDSDYNGAPASLVHQKDRKTPRRRHSVVLTSSGEAAPTDVVAEFKEVTGRSVVAMSIHRDSDVD